MLVGLGTPNEFPAMMAWLEGERRTKVLAGLLRLAHLSEIEQRVEVKRFKDRLARRLVRLFHAANRKVGG